METDILETIKNTLNSSEMVKNYEISDDVINIEFNEAEVVRFMLSEPIFVLTDKIYEMICKEIKDPEEQKLAIILFSRFSMTGRKECTFDVNDLMVQNEMLKDYDIYDDVTHVDHGVIIHRHVMNEKMRKKFEEVIPDIYPDICPGPAMPYLTVEEQKSICNYTSCGSLWIAYMRFGKDEVLEKLWYWGKIGGITTK